MISYLGITVSSFVRDSVETTSLKATPLLSSHEAGFCSINIPLFTPGAYAEMRRKVAGNIYDVLPAHIQGQCSILDASLYTVEA